MSDQDIPKNDAENTKADESRNIRRQELLKKGWIVPAVVAITLPTAVQAQTAVPVEADSDADDSPAAPATSHLYSGW